MSQFGEDILVEPHLPEVGIAVEVGATDGISLSNTLRFEDKGWTVLCIEPNPLYKQRLERSRKFVQMVACGERDAEDVLFTSFEMQPGVYEAVSGVRIDPEQWKRHQHLFRGQVQFRVPMRRLDRCIEEAGFLYVDYISIDAEGYDWEVLQGLTLSRWNPKVVIVENWKEEERFREYMAKDGYRLLERTGNTNDIYLSDREEPTSSAA